MKYLKTFDQLQESILNETSYTDFLTSYGKELKNSVKMLKNIFSSTKEIPENFHDKIDKVLQNYDDNVDRLIFGNNENATVDDIAKFAINNMNRYGTEPQMVLFAIGEVYDLLSGELRLEKIREDITDGSPYDLLDTSQEVEDAEEEELEEVSKEAQEYISNKISKLHDEGYENPQAVAMAYSYAKKAGYRVPKK